LTGRSTASTRAISVLSPKNSFQFWVFSFQPVLSCGDAITENSKLKTENCLPLALFVLGVRADHAHHALAVDDLAVVAHLLDRSPDLHFESSPLSGNCCRAAPHL